MDNDKGVMFYLGLTVCLSICLSVRKITRKVMNNFDDFFLEWRRLDPSTSNYILVAIRITGLSIRITIRVHECLKDYLFSLLLRFLSAGQTNIKQSLAEA